MKRVPDDSRYSFPPQAKENLPETYQKPTVIPVNHNPGRSDPGIQDFQES